MTRGKSTGHLTVRSGKKVIVWMVDGNHFVAKFKEKHARHLEFFDHAPVKHVGIRTITIYKPNEKL